MWNITGYFSFIGDMKAKLSHLSSTSDKLFHESPNEKVFAKKLMLLIMSIDL